MDTENGTRARLVLRTKCLLRNACTPTHCPILRTACPVNAIPRTSVQTLKRPFRYCGLLSTTSALMSPSTSAQLHIPQSAFQTWLERRVEEKGQEQKAQQQDETERTPAVATPPLRSHATLQLSIFVLVRVVESGLILEASRPPTGSKETHGITVTCLCVT